MVQLWEVTGGVGLGGILIREGQDVGSPKCAERLSTGALVEEIALIGERLHYKLLEGSGPAEGWASIVLPGKELLVRTSKKPAKYEKPAPAPTRSMPEVKAPARVETTTKPSSTKPSSTPSAMPAAVRPATIAAPVSEKVSVSLNKDARAEVQEDLDFRYELGTIGDSSQRSSVVLKPVGKIIGIPKDGFGASMSWDAPISHLHDALCVALGVKYDALSLAWKGKELEDDMTFLNIGIIGSTRMAKQRAAEMQVDLAYMLEPATVVKMKPRVRNDVSKGVPESSADPQLPQPSSETTTTKSVEATSSGAVSSSGAQQQRFASQLVQLAGMGFTDQDLLLPLLESNRGNVQQVVELLLA
mmetsp:Transcript_128614/g.274395  ORF Transcript_128614/g.274395 Transcript_128614/m.274395 type:complete len:358 (-) Transcript_128614:161-1234(-)|eukprot:CAMPEP_0180702524 /NCGR_PEP_ID=MMETSP1038_2-20121128/6163_1 /TAXON_ID=632150 /ORGANISM="Azadinium spinosum, Strain 3D9" /LENGTH=357 /DNA_ID=CAMNT_0022734285 /DNA_START=33 /DNA_END=1106 /DNA_ORIENTATION=-